MNLWDLERWIAPLRRAVRGMLAKALLDSISDTADLQLGKASINGETHSGIERIQDYGLTSRPVKGAQAIVLFIGGNRDHPVIIAADDGRYRPKLNAGEVALYSKFGSLLKFDDDGKIVLGNEDAELLDLFDQLLAKLKATVVVTAVGTYPISTAVSGEIQAIENLLDLIRGSMP